MKCPKCTFDGNPNLEEVKMHTKATCPDCGAYIKMVGREERDAIMDETNRRWAKAESGVVDTEEEITFTIKTKAPFEYMPDILTQVRTSLKEGYVCGTSSIKKPFDAEGYPYEFYYNK